MQMKSLLLTLALGLVSASEAVNEGGVVQNNVDVQGLARSAASPHKDTLKEAIHHLHRRSGAHEQQAEKPNHKLRSRKAHQSGFDPESFVSNAIGNVGPDDSPILINFPGESSGNTGSGTVTGTGAGNTGGGNTGGDSTGVGDTGTSIGVPASNNPPARQVNNPTTSAKGSPSSQSSVPAASGGNCNNNPSSTGCANEDGPATGDPGWTCRSGGSNSQPTSRDLTSLRFHKRQNTPAYVQTLNTWRCKFCLPPLTYDSALEQSAQRQSNDAASQGRMVETPSNRQGTVMAEGGGSDFQNAVLFWLCEVHTTNIDSCTCANVYSKLGFQWTERGHYDFLVGKQAGEFGSVGCAYNDAMGGLWTCALGMQ